MIQLTTRCYNLIFSTLVCAGEQRASLRQVPGLMPAAPAVFFCPLSVELPNIAASILGGRIKKRSTMVMADRF